MSYALKSGVYLVTGINRGAILDTNTGLVYSVNGLACKILSNVVEDSSYWDQLVQLGIAETTETPRTSTIPQYERSTALEFVWFEVVTDDCNERCIHCYGDSMPCTYRKLSLAPLPLSTLEPTIKQRMTYLDWLKVMKEAYDLGCRECQLIGGEPFLYTGEDGETLLDLAEYLVKLGYTLVEIYTNGTLITPSKVARIKELGLQMAISLYSSDPEVHDAITRTPGSHVKTLNAIKLLKEADVPVRVETIIMRTNQETMCATQSLKDSLGVDSGTPDPLRPLGRGSDSTLQPDLEYLALYGLLMKPDFVVSSEILQRYTSGHSCLLGKITITEFGEVLPCVFARDTIVGNILKEASLEAILLGNLLTEIWGATKDQVLVCKDCEYRYVCFDCRPLSVGASGGSLGFINAPYPRCTYNPYTGDWAQGVWKVTLDGVPFYDTTDAMQIQKIALSMNHRTSTPVSH